MTYFLYHDHDRHVSISDSALDSHPWEPQEKGDQGRFRRDQGIQPSSAIWRSPLVTNPIIGAVGRVARARMQRAHRRWGIEGSDRLPSGGRT
jgi:hypothetical protein